MFDAGAVVASLILDRSDFTRGLAAAQSEADKGIHVPVTFDISQASVTKATSAAQRLFAASPVSVSVLFDINQASVTRATAAARKLFAGSPVTAPLVFSVSPAAVTAAVTAANRLFAAKPVTAPVTFSVTAASVARTVTAAKALFAANPVTVPVGFSVAGAGAAAAAATRLAGASRNAGSAWGFFTGLLTKQLPLFGLMKGQVLATDDAVTRLLKTVGNSLPHILTAVAGWHLLTDWVIEFAAVLIPAGIALGAFGLAAASTVMGIVTQLKNASVVSNATGLALAPLSGGFQKLQAAVQPQVLQLYGDVLTVMASKSGALTSVVTQTGHALDYLGARTAVAITQGKGMGGIMASGAADVAKLGDIVGNFGGVLGNVLKAMPGYAVIFLNLWDALSKGAEAVTAVTIPLMHAGLALHGLLIYAGLAVTAVMLLRAPLTALAVRAGVAADGMLMLAGSMVTAAASGDVFGAAMLLIDATGGPVLWIAAAVAALGVLTVSMVTSKDATGNWISGLQQAVANAPTISAGITAVGNAQAAVTGRIVGAARQVNQAMAQTGPAVTGIASRFSSSYNPALDHAATKLGELTTAQQGFRTQAAQSSTELDTLGKRYGTNASALGLLNLAGVTQAEWMDHSAHGIAIVNQMLAAMSAALKDTGVAGGIAGNDLLVLDNQTNDTALAIGKLNGYLDTWIGNVTKTQGAFDTLALGNVALAQNFTKANEAVKITSHTLGGVKATSNLAGAAMDGLSQASLTLNQAFGTQVTNVQALLDSWRVAYVAQNLQTQGTKDAIAPLLKYAAGSSEATAQLAALAEEAGYNGPASMKALTKWLGNTHDATASVKSITNQATIQEALLTTAMQGQGSCIANKLLGDLSDAEIKYGKVATAVSAWGQAIANEGVQSTQAQAARKVVIDDILQTGKNADWSTLKIAGLITKLTGIPLKKAVQIVVTGDGSYKVVNGSAAPGGGGRHYLNSATGRLVTGGIPGRDSVPIMAMPGEVVVPTRMVNAGAVDHLRGRLPGFAGGGVVGSYAGTAPGVGAWAAAEYRQTLTSIEQSVAAAAAAAMKAAVAAASASSFGAAGPGGGAPSANAALARGMYPGENYAAWNYVAMRESGWNQFARNPSSGAYGIAQALPPTKYPFAGQAAGGSNPAAQISWMEGYMQSRYGGAAGAAAHERAFNWYAGGTRGAAPGWAKVGERGQELVHFHGGETVLPNSVTNRVMSGSVAMPGYAGGTGSGGGGGSAGSGAGARQRAADEAKMKRFESQLTALERKAAARIRKMRLPIDQEELDLLEHPHMSAAAKKVLEANISGREAAVRKYRGTVTGEEGTLSREISLLRKLIASEPAGKTPVGHLPPGLLKGGSKKQELAELAKIVTELDALKKKAKARVAALRKPVEEEELYLLLHPGLPAGTKAAIEAKLKKDEAAVAKYRQGTGAQESGLQQEITLLRSLTGEPAGAKYGGPGSGSGGGGGGSGGGGTTTPPPGHFVGTLPAPPGQGGALPAGGGTGGLGGSPGDTAATAAAGAAYGGSSLAMTPGIPGVPPGSSFSMGAGSTGYAAAAAWLAAPPAPPMSGASIEKLLTQLLQATRAVPAQTGGHLGAALNGVSRAALAKATWNPG